MAIYHVERTITVSEQFVEVWEVEAASPEEAQDLAPTSGTRLSTESEGSTISEDCITGTYLVAE